MAASTEPLFRGGNHEGRRFFQGDRLTLTFALPLGEVNLTVSVVLDGPIVRLWDAEVTTSDGMPLAAGVRGIRAILRDLCAVAVEEGFDRIVISGFRVSGANPERETEWVVPCGKLRDSSPQTDWEEQE